MSDNRCVACVYSLKRIRARRVRIAHNILRNTLFLQNTALREELVDGDGHLRVHRPVALVAPANDNDVVLAPNQVRTVSNGDGGLELVASGDPNLDPGLLEVCDRLGHAVLQTIFDGGSAEETEVALELFTDGLDTLLPLIKRYGGFVVPSIPLLVFVSCLLGQ